MKKDPAGYVLNDKSLSTLQMNKLSENMMPGHKV